MIGPKEPLAKPKEALKKDHFAKHKEGSIKKGKNVVQRTIRSIKKHKEEFAFYNEEAYKEVTFASHSAML